MKRKTENKKRFKTVKKRTINGKVVSRLVENRFTGERKLTCDIDAVCNG
jgi:hypothetical protein